MKEHWLPVAGYEGFYEVSDQGRVKSLDRIVECRNGVLKPIKGRILQVSPDSLGYYYVILTVEGVAKTFHVARLVLEAFVGPCPRGFVARHFPDRNPANNRKANLSWSTKSVNQRDRVIHGTSNRGEQHGAAKLTERKVRRIRRLCLTGNRTQRSVAAEYKVSPMTISLVVRRKYWRHVA